MTLRLSALSGQRISLGLGLGFQERSILSLLVCQVLLLLALLFGVVSHQGIRLERRDQQLLEDALL